MTRPERPTIKTRTARSARARLTALFAALVGTVLFAGCGGHSIEGTYTGSSDHTALIIQKDGTCLYTEDYDAEEPDPEDLKPENMDKCTWTNSGDNYTFTGVSSGTDTLQATLSDDGKSLTIPDQGDSWNGEVFTKQK